METLAYLHLVLTHQEFNQKSEPQETSKPDNLGASWDKDAWEEIFEEPKPDTTKKPKK